MNKNEMIDVFISYRREGGATAARLLYEVLKARNITGFMDAETLSSGDYKSSIRAHIKKANNFLLVVSSGVLDSDWVRAEIRFALEDKKKIIPVFVNGMTSFPSELPSEFKCIDVNGIPLNHENFESNISKLISWLETRHNSLLHSLISVLDESTALNSLFNCWVNVSDSKKIKRFLMEKVKNGWQSNGDSLSVNEFLNEFDTSELKVVMKELSIEYKGERGVLLQRISSWLKNNDSKIIAEDSGEHEERYCRLIKQLAVWFKSGSDLVRLKECCDEYGIYPESARSSIYYMQAIYKSTNVNGVHDIFKIIRLSENEVKGVAEYFLDYGTGRKKELICAISDWVNYQDE